MVLVGDFLMCLSAEGSVDAAVVVETDPAEQCQFEIEAVSVMAVA
jgi:hypothetical protein